MKQLAVLILPLALAACGDAAVHNNQASPAAPAANGAANAAQSAGNEAAAPADETVRTETVTATFTGWEMGDYLWANFAVPGRDPVAAQPGPTPIDLFLDAHRGQQVTVEIATVRTDIPEAGGTTEIQRIVAARDTAGDAASWWRGLPEAERAAAQRRFEEGALSGR